MLIAPEHKVVLIRINQTYQPEMSEEDLYEATRGTWVLNPRLREPDWALAVYKGKVLAVYRIGQWHELAGGRWEFSGTRDPGMESRYLDQDISEYFPRGTANPIMYRNCPRLSRSR